MASNHTEHFGLNQWDLSDSVLMADFNEDNQKIDAALAAGMKIQSGTYTGTGEFGPDHPTSITFPFEPKLVIVRTRDLDMYDLGAAQLMVWINGTTEDSIDNAGTTRHFTLEGNTLSWYVDGRYPSTNWQMSNKGSYPYIAIG